MHESVEKQGKQDRFHPQWKKKSWSPKVKYKENNTEKQTEWNGEGEKNYKFKWT